MNCVYFLCKHSEQDYNTPKHQHNMIYSPRAIVTTIAVALLQPYMASGANVRQTIDVVDNKNAELRFGDDDKEGNCKTLELNFVPSLGTFTTPMMASLSFYHPMLKNEDGEVVAELAQSCETLVPGPPGAGIRDMCQLALLFLPLENGIFQDRT
jgi:hypothetical protein